MSGPGVAVSARHATANNASVDRSASQILMKEGPVLVGLKKSVQIHARGVGHNPRYFKRPSIELSEYVCRGRRLLTFFGHNLLRHGLGTPAFDKGGSVAAKGDQGMQVAKSWLSLLAVGAMSVLIGGGAHAQNLDQGKPAPKLFADGCATCHRSARGLAKGRVVLCRTSTA